ncbi:MAG TPA: class I adenylate-forming enzyme family protein [Candidatus Marinimicrobia bacterium]|nr:class I adenylate-forming enzyme family protein [Candidatus Neomarinimicrobiota bacterium]HRS51326.1 class I adenylate-forming enzyme family protein [Candidatus Neomarinimicrobiota bacterium]HRU91436.1 class I adenylate-forming enzyme family protein [Candidatus Neomarinimicrobiota bacterium]
MLNNVIKILIQNWNTRADFPAVIFNGQTITYSQIYLQSVRLAEHLQKQKILTGQTIGLLFQNEPDYLIAYYACLLNGFLPVLLPTYLSTNKFTYNFNKLKIETVLYGSEFQKIIDEIELKKGSPLIKISSNNWKDNSVNKTNAAPLSADLFPGINYASEPAAITFTDGNSGFPKAVMHNQTSLLANAQNCLKLFGSMRTVRLLCTVPIFHFISHSFIPHTIGLAGGTVILVENLKIEEIIQTINLNQVNTLIGTPIFFKEFIKSAKTGELSSLKHCIISGAYLAPEIRQTLMKNFGVFVTELYGTTETQMVSVVYDEFDQYECSIGRPFPEIDIRIVNSSGASVAPGTSGELQVRSPALMLNYFNDLDRIHFNQNTWFRTGDIVRETNDGSLIFEGRIPDLIYKFGYDINPALIEKVLQQHPAVREAMVCPIKVPNHEDQIKASVSLRESGSVSIDELNEFCRNNLPGYLRPDLIDIVAYFERDLSGKILRNLVNKS